MISSQINVRKLRTKGHEQVFSFQWEIKKHCPIIFPDWYFNRSVFWTYHRIQMRPGRLQENSKQQSKTAVLQRLKTVIPVFFSNIQCCNCINKKGLSWLSFNDLTNSTKKLVIIKSSLFFTLVGFLVSKVVTSITYSREQIFNFNNLWFAEIFSVTFYRFLDLPPALLSGGSWAALVCARV